MYRVFLDETMLRIVRFSSYESALTDFETQYNPYRIQNMLTRLLWFGISFEASNKGEDRGYMSVSTELFIAV